MRSRFIHYEWGPWSHDPQAVVNLAFRPNASAQKAHHVSSDLEIVGLSFDVILLEADSDRIPIFLVFIGLRVFGFCAEAILLICQLLYAICWTFILVS